jgi:hypothetical protein
VISKLSDDGGATGSSFQSVTVSDDPSGGVELDAMACKVGGHKLPIRPAGAAGGSLSTSSVTANIRPNSVNDGAQTGEIGTKGGGSYDY